MKVVKRIGVFETNSSSTHSLVLARRSELEEDKQKPKPKFAKHKQLTDKKDKLLMACGCCHELYPKDKDKPLIDYEYMKKSIEQNAYFYLTCYDISYDTAIDVLVGIYCEITGEDPEKIKSSVNRKNSSGRACHKMFFEEGALYDEHCDYDVIDRLFTGSPRDIISHVRDYFDDDNVLCYREFWNGIGDIR